MNRGRGESGGEERPFLLPSCLSTRFISFVQGRSKQLTSPAEFRFRFSPRRPGVTPSSMATTISSSTSPSPSSPPATLDGVSPTSASGLAASTDGNSESLGLAGLGRGKEDTANN
jgi:hypothetical protein